VADIAPIWNSFNAGELSPLMDGRTDQPQYFSGCKVMQNFIPTVQGPAARRGGTRYIGATKSNARAWLVPFEFSQDQSYVLEFGNSYLRFWVNRGQLLSSGSPYEVVSPWTSADLLTDDGTLALRTAQSADIMWQCLASGTKPPYKLSRLGATNWTQTAVAFNDGPFNDVDPKSTIVVRASATEGTVTLTSSAALFRASDVGTSFFLQAQSFSDVQPWRTEQNASSGDTCQHEGNYYRAVAIGSAGKFGYVPPTHLGGLAKDGDDNVTWLYLHSGYGWARITAFGSSTSVTATVLSYIPDSIKATGSFPSPVIAGEAPATGTPVYVGGTNRWARAAFNDTDGWPTSVAFFRERLFWGRGLNVYGSAVKNFDNYERFEGPDLTTETAINLKLATDRLDLIRWLVGDRTLLVGSSRGELSIQEATPQAVFAADNVTGVPQTEYGSTQLEPLRAAGAVLFVQRSGRRMRELKFDLGTDSYKAEELTVLSEHILQPGVVDMDFQQEPDSLVWCAMGDGSLSALSYNRERGVLGWAPHYIGGPSYAVTDRTDGTLAVTGFGIVESVVSIAQPDNRRDDLWMIVRRTINGSTKRYVEVVEDNKLYESGLAYSFYLDSGISRLTGGATTTITGLSHLEGATVQILADGSPHPDRTVVSGSITLDYEATVVHVGFHAPARLKTMRVDAAGSGGSMQTKVKSLSEVWLRLLDTVGGGAGPTFARIDPLPFTDPLATFGTPIALFSGDRELTWPATMDTDGYVCVEQSQPLPMTLVAIVGRLDPAEDNA
jgi:hypothetical protein